MIWSFGKEVRLRAVGQFLRAPKLRENEKESLAKDMLLYCKRDTEAMVAIVDRLTEVAGAQKV
jgi:hypothetical protein